VINKNGGNFRHFLWAALLEILKNVKHSFFKTPWQFSINNGQR
jgi:hypothetical protein